MTTLEQAARQALETLERASDAGYSVECDETITALREALEKAAPKAAPGEVSDTQHSQFLSDVLTAAGLITHGKRCKALGERLSDMVMRLRAAPQQEAQEPVAYIHVPHHTVEGKVHPVVSFEKYQQDYADGIYSTRIPLYTAPQPAPAPLSDDAKDAMRYRWLRNESWAGYHSGDGTPKVFTLDGAGNRRVQLAEEAMDAAIDAARARRGEKT